VSGGEASAELAMKLFVTGGTGFLGRHLVRALIGWGHQVRVLGRNPRACQELAALGAEVRRADVRDAAAVAAACEGVQAVFHVAALSAAWGRSGDFHSINVGGTRHVIAGCLAHRVGRLVHVSSPSVIFHGADLHLATEAAPYPHRYLAAYSRSKKLSECLVNRAARRHGLAAVILRPKAIFGPGDSSLLPKLLAVARKGRLPQVGPGENRVDLTYVENVVHAMLLALTAPRAPGRTYTITNGEHVLLWPLIRTVLRRLGVEDRLRPLPYWLVYALAAGMELRATVTGQEPLLTRYTTAILGRTQTYDVSAARNDLGYSPVVSVAEGVERTLAHLRGQTHE
jgi:nucleoside-diphosphate-sugar epimerase